MMKIKILRQASAAILCTLLAGCSASSGGDQSDGGETVRDGSVPNDGSDAAAGDSGTDDAGGQVTPPDLSLEWVLIEAGTYRMGSDANYEPDEAPVHQVTVPDVELTRTEVTVSDYRQCVEAGVCSDPTQKAYCNWKFLEERLDHPINCVDWHQAVEFCEWVGGRLPTEAEWEFAARSRDKNWLFTWDPNEKHGDYCNYCVMSTSEVGKWGCEEERTWPVCSKPEGNTLQGLCDMCGNVEEMLADHTHRTYVGAPTDGRPWINTDNPDAKRATRGGSAYNSWEGVRVTNRYSTGQGVADNKMGFRCARSETEYGEWDGSGAVELHDLDCAALQEGWNNRLIVGNRARSFILTLPEGVDKGGPWPVVFNWHGLGDDATNFAWMLDGLVDDPDYPFIAVTPADADFALVGVPMDWNVFRVNEKNQEIQFFDAMLECLQSKYDIDMDRIHSMGFSLGSIASDLIGTMRSDVIASIATYSGCYWSNEQNLDPILKTQIGWPPFETQNKYAQFFIHGGVQDRYPLLVTNIFFDRCAVNDSEMLSTHGHDTLLCSHNSGHTVVMSENPPDHFIDFFKAHPRGTVQSPYRAGLPADLPDNCVFKEGE
jgi:formylglycine-generating enzyme required for sulfatase activity/predicted esterase